MAGSSIGLPLFGREAIGGPDVELFDATGNPAIRFNQPLAFTAIITPEVFNASSDLGPPVVIVPGVPGAIICAMYLLLRIKSGTEAGTLLPDPQASGFVAMGIRNEYANGIFVENVFDFTPVTFTSPDGDCTSSFTPAFPFGAGISTFMSGDPAYIGADLVLGIPAGIGYSGGNWSASLTTIYVLNDAS